MRDLFELPFKDLYIRVDADAPLDFDSRYHITPVRGQPYVRQNVAVPDEFKEAIHELRPMLRGFGKDNFAFDLKGVRMRGVRYKVVNGQQWVSLRSIAQTLPDLDSLGFTPDVLSVFRSWGKRTGLIIVGGATGSGKTTTTVGLLRDYLFKLGGTLYTIEDPVEFVMQGPLGERGFVIQREVHEEEEWGEAVKDALRSAPTYIFLGEVRTAAAARQLLRASTSGHLVICTVHGSSVEETIGAIIQIAEAELGPLAYNLLAEGLCGVIHQNIVKGKPEVSLLQTVEGGRGGADPVRVAVRSNKLIYLGTQIEAQAAIRGRQEAARVARADARAGEKADSSQDGDDGDTGGDAIIAPKTAIPRAVAAGNPIARPPQQQQRAQPPRPVTAKPVEPDKKRWFSK